MSKALATAAEIVGVAAIVVATAPLFGPGAAAAATSVAGSLGLASSATLAAALGAVSAGFSVAASIANKPPSSTVNPTRWNADPEAGIPYVIGRTADGGLVTYRTGTDHDRNQSLCAALASLARNGRRALRRGWARASRRFQSGAARALSNSHCDQRAHRSGPPEGIARQLVFGR